MNVDGVIANLLQGISQQQQQSRLPGQCTDQVNAVNDIVDGWKRRPPTEFIALLDCVAGLDNAKWHFYNTGLEQYLVCVAPDGTLAVFDMQGNSPYIAGASLYFNILSFTNPDDLSMVTIGDYTIIANSKARPAMATDTAEAWSNTALVYLRDGGEYGRTYKIILEGIVVATYTTPGGAAPATDAQLTGTEYVTQMLYAALTSTANNGTLSIRDNYTYRITGSIIEVTRITGTADILIEVTDDRGGQFAKIIQRSVSKPGDLPKCATPGMVVEVTGEGTSDKDDYYLKFTVEHGTSTFGTPGVWRECCKPGVQRRLDASTLPHALIRLPDSTWAFTPLDGSELAYGENLVERFTVEHWRLRSAGNEETNRAPSIIGKSINFLGTFSDRMYLLADEGAVFSSTGSYFDLFNKTALTILDSDPIDMPSAGNSIVKLRKATQHDKNLVILADGAQFVVPGNKPLTPKSSMILTTSYEADLLATPVPAGAGVLFPITYGTYAGIREFTTTAGETDTNSSQPITAHVPKLMPGSVLAMTASSNFDVVFVQATEGANKLYLYKHLWQDGQRVQASWGVWEYHKDSTVCFMFIIDAFVYVVLRYGTQYMLERHDLTDVAPTGMPYNIFLDSRILVDTFINTLAIPFGTAHANLMEDLVVIQGPGCTYPGAPLVVTAIVGNAVTLSTVPVGQCFVGLRTRASYTPTMPMIKDTNGGVVSNANFILGKFMVSFRNTGHMRAIIRNKHYPDYVQTYYGRTLGTPEATIGAPVVASGILEVTARKDAKYTELILDSDSHLPMGLLAIEWTGDYTKSGRRL